MGKNFKGIHEELKKKEVMKTGSRVYIIGGTHKDMQGKIVAWSDPNASIKQQKKTMGE